MTNKHAQILMEDLGKNLTKDDYIENIYMSINGVGNRVFKNCAYFEAEGYAFIWTETENFMLSKKKYGNFVLLPYEVNNKITLKKVI